MQGGISNMEGSVLDNFGNGLIIARQVTTSK
jgi:hypothetical protein